MLTYIPSRLDSTALAEIGTSDMTTRDIIVKFMENSIDFPVTIATVDLTLHEAKSFIMQLGDKIRELEEKKNYELREQNRVKLLTESQEENTLA